MTKRRRAMIILGVILLLVVTVVVADYLWIKFAGTPVPVPQISREPRTFGKGEPLKFVMLGDSRAVGQGGDYETGVTVSAAEHLAKNRQVTLYNFGVSGAVTDDVLRLQLPQAVAVKPDVTMIYIGANDVTHRSNRGEVNQALIKTIETLIATKCDMKIIVTDAGAMWSVPRIPHPLRFAAGISSKRLNGDFGNIALKYGLTFAPVAAETGAAFVHDHSNYAVDKFHPSEKGYRLITEALLPYLDEALASQPTHCG